MAIAVKEDGSLQPAETVTRNGDVFDHAKVVPVMDADELRRSIGKAEGSKQEQEIGAIVTAAAHNRCISTCCCCCCGCCCLVIACSSGDR